MDHQIKTIAFTLPISCHICLGKVKQPVTCSNQHVFCRTCLLIWLDRSPACPTCRTPIDDDHPFNSILGGTEVENQGEQRWDLLRTRIEISLREYEEGFTAQMQRNQTLENENKNLLEKLASTVQHAPETVADLGDYTVLNEELKESKNAYDRAKKEISELKKANRTLTDQNVNLVREADLLRLEVSKRSPQMFGRITVATLQSKLEAGEKKVKQLQKALEKTDDYVNELQSKLKRCGCSDRVKEEPRRTDTKLVEDVKDVPTPSKSSCQRNLLSSLKEGNARTAEANEKPKASNESRSHGTDPSQMAAFRVACSRVQSGRPDSPMTKNAPYRFASPSKMNVNIRGEASVDRSNRLATSPTKRMRLDEDDSRR